MVSKRPSPPMHTHTLGGAAPSAQPLKQQLTPVKEATTWKETLALGPLRLSAMIRSHFPHGGEARWRRQGKASSVQLSTFWKERGSVAEPSVTRRAQATDVFAVQFPSKTSRPLLNSGTKILWEGGREGGREP